jgi:hypothetical protein
MNWLLQVSSGAFEVENLWHAIWSCLICIHDLGPAIPNSALQQLIKKVLENAYIRSSPDLRVVLIHGLLILILALSYVGGHVPLQPPPLHSHNHSPGNSGNMISLMIYFHEPPVHCSLLAAPPTFSFERNFGLWTGYYTETASEKFIVVLGRSL